jgi:hypothetical protein
MRIYSNTLLSLPHIIHVLHKPYTGWCGNLYTFRPLGILNAQWPPAAEPFEDTNCGAKPHKLPVSNSQRSNAKSGHTSITVRPFIVLLQENRKYYCYDTFSRNKHIEKFGNISRTISEKNTCIYIPQFSTVDDIFIIKDDKPSQIPSVNLPTWLKFYSPPLL